MLKHFTDKELVWLLKKAKASMKHENMAETCRIMRKAIVAEMGRRVAADLQAQGFVL